MKRVLPVLLALLMVSALLVPAMAYTVRDPVYIQGCDLGFHHNETAGTSGGQSVTKKISPKYVAKQGECFAQSEEDPDIWLLLYPAVYKGTKELAKDENGNQIYMQPYETSDQYEPQYVYKCPVCGREDWVTYSNMSPGDFQQNFSGKNIQVGHAEAFSKGSLEVSIEVKAQDWYNEYKQDWHNEYKQDWRCEYLQDWHYEYKQDWHNEYKQDWHYEYLQDWHNEYKQDWHNEYKQDWHYQYLQDWHNEYQQDWHNVYKQDWRDVYTQGWHNEYLPVFEQQICSVTGTLVSGITRGYGEDGKSGLDGGKLKNGMTYLRVKDIGQYTAENPLKVWLADSGKNNTNFDYAYELYVEDGKVFIRFNEQLAGVNYGILVSNKAFSGNPTSKVSHDNNPNGTKVAADKNGYTYVFFHGTAVSWYPEGSTGEYVFTGWQLKGKVQEEPAFVKTENYGDPYGETKVNDGIPYGGTKVTDGDPYGGTKVTDGDPYDETRVTDGDPYGGTKVNDGDPYGGTKVTDGDPYDETKVTDSDPYNETKVTDGDPYGKTKVNYGDPYGETKVTDGDPYGETKINDGDPYVVSDFSGYYTVTVKKGEELIGTANLTAIEKSRLFTDLVPGEYTVTLTWQEEIIGSKTVTVTSGATAFAAFTDTIAGEQKADVIKAGEQKADVVKDGEQKADVIKDGEQGDDEIKGGKQNADEIKGGKQNADVIKAGKQNADEIKDGEQKADEIKAGEQKADVVKDGKQNADVIKAGVKGNDQFVPGVQAEDEILPGEEGTPVYLGCGDPEHCHACDQCIAAGAIIK